jgi:hypothetical protein
MESYPTDYQKNRENFKDYPEFKVRAYADYESENNLIFEKGFMIPPNWMFSQPIENKTDKNKSKKK